LSSCNTYKDTHKYPQFTDNEYRTLWAACWDADGEFLPPSDNPPHKPKCDNPEPIKWRDGKVRVAILSLGADWHKELVRNAMAQWNLWLGWEMFVETTYAHDVLIVYGGDGGWKLGLIDLRKEEGRIGGVIFLFDMPDALVYKVILHEMGHVLGLAHDVEDPRGFLMSPGASTHGEMVAPEDVRALRRLYGRLALP
jgi:hypothetical protein